MLTGSDDGCGFELRATKESNGVPRLSCGGAAVTSSVTAIVCEWPAQAGVEQVTVTVPE